MTRSMKQGSCTPPPSWEVTGFKLRRGRVPSGVENPTTVQIHCCRLWESGSRCLVPAKSHRRRLVSGPVRIQRPYPLFFRPCSCPCQHPFPKFRSCQHRHALEDSLSGCVIQRVHSSLPCTYAPLNPNLLLSQRTTEVNRPHHHPEHQRSNGTMSRSPSPDPKSSPRTVEQVPPR